jgi:hypothetical protein
MKDLGTGKKTAPVHRKPFILYLISFPKPG